MTPKHFVYLAVAAALSVLFAVVSYASNNRWSTSRVDGVKLLPSLVTEAPQIGAIEVRQGETTVTLEKTAAGWGVKERGGYPVETAKVRALLVGLAETELVEGKTRRPDRYAALELEDPADKGAKSRLVRLIGAKGSPVAEVVLGKKRYDALGVGKSVTYVRKPGDPQTWLTNAELEAPTAVKDWIATSVLSLDSSKIARISVEIPGEEALKIERESAAANDAKDGMHAVDTPSKLRFAGFPAAGKKLKDASAADGIARAVSSIDMEDMRKLDAAPSGAGVSVVKIESANGPATTLRLRKDGDATWLSVAATGEGEAKKAADDIAKRTQGWEFKVPGWKADAILKKRADLLDAPAS
jgi:Domain of unknown function (DUF4340)